MVFGAFAALVAQSPEPHTSLIVHGLPSSQAVTAFVLTQRFEPALHVSFVQGLPSSQLTGPDTPHWAAQVPAQLAERHSAAAAHATPAAFFAAQTPAAQ